MGLILIAIGLLILIPFPFIMIRKMKKMNRGADHKLDKKDTLTLLCSMPIPLVGFACLIRGITYFIH